MKIKAINKVGKKKVYDLSVQDAEHYVLQNGVVTHNTGIYYSANTIFIVGRQQEKVGTEIQGYNFILNVEKSRFVKEKSKIPINVTFGGGISQHSALLDIAMVTGHVAKPSNGWYQKVDTETGELIGTKLRTKDVGPMLMELTVDESFKEKVKEMYQLGTLPMLDFDQDVIIDPVKKSEQSISVNPAMESEDE